MADRAGGLGTSSVTCSNRVFPLGIALRASRCNNQRWREPSDRDRCVVLIAALSRSPRGKRVSLRATASAGNGRTLPADAAMLGTWAAPRHPVQLRVCWSNATLLVVGVMDLRSWSRYGRIPAERLASNGKHVARAIGAIVVVAGMFLTATAAGLC